jgi:hypothetical protein
LGQQRPLAKALNAVRVPERHNDLDGHGDQRTP